MITFQCLHKITYDYSFKIHKNMVSQVDLLIKQHIID